MSVTDEGLKQQFKLLQEQQQKKLEKRKQRKDDQEKQKRDAQIAKNTPPSFGIEDDLNLKLAEPPTNVGISEELVDHLNDEIRELKDETGRLYKLLSEKDFEIRQLKKKREEDKIALAGTGGVTNETAATKIVELSKKVRELTAECESEKTKAKQYAKKCKDLEHDVKNVAQNDGKKAGETTARSLKSDALEKGPVTEADLKRAEDKLKHTEGKVVENKSQIQALKQELQKAHKIITQEVGDGVNIQGLLTQTSQWKGRAQQVMLLQKKVNELRLELTHYKLSGTTASEVSLDDEFMGSSASLVGRTKTGSVTSSEYRNVDTIRKLEKERKETQERAVAELKALEEDYTQLKQKFDASKARHKVLTNENKSLKQQMQTLLEKGKHDDDLIQAMMKQQTQLKLMLDETTNLQKQTEDFSEKKVKELEQRSQQDSNIVEQLKRIVADKEAKVKQFEEEIRQMKLNSLQKAQNNGVGSLFESRPSTAASQIPVAVTVLPERRESVMIMESVSPPASRQSSRAQSRMTDSRRSSRPMSRLQSTGAANKEVEEYRVQLQEYKSMQLAAEVERDKLAELVKLLQQRLNESTQKATESQTDLQNQKRRNVALEKQLGKAKIEQKQAASLGYSPAKKPGKSKSNNTSATGSHETMGIDDELNKDSPIDANIDELQTSLEIQRDENEALKEALQSTLRAKEEDLRLYHQTIDETRKIFLHGLRQFKTES
ncbi:coiled-coil domain-containing protein 13-like [Lineus longissimus]|uniref:coiled-coil domain-containing protein 13-like n=1 Tax=Lineus longissimus TaxID=88925 RepID=UPI002B4E5178